jgi:hypothetical protein
MKALPLLRAFIMLRVLLFRSNESTLRLKSSFRKKSALGLVDKSDPFPEAVD